MVKRWTLGQVRAVVSTLNVCMWKVHAVPGDKWANCYAMARGADDMASCHGFRIWFDEQRPQFRYMRIRTGTMP